jgi:hypothetical protein
VLLGQEARHAVCNYCLCVEPSWSCEHHSSSMRWRAVAGDLGAFSLVMQHIASAACVRVPAPPKRQFFKCITEILADRRGQARRQHATDSHHH